jgi:ribosomal protein L11 methyltransferase
LKTHAALEFTVGATDLLLAALDDFSPTAVEERDDGVRVFFNSSRDRDAARSAVATRFPADPVDVPDDDWARRSQDNLGPVTIGRITIVPRLQSEISDAEINLKSEICDLKSPLSLVIPPSMGFGTGHHATTRLCLEALQALDLRGARVLDVGTGSGILAIAAAALGASVALGIDPDEDAIAAALDNLAHNPAVRGVTFEVADLASMTPAASRVLGGAADVVTANLTGALHVRSVRPLTAAARPGGILILSGIQAHERDEVLRAFGQPAVIRERTEDEWVCLVVKRA